MAAYRSPDGGYPRYLGDIKRENPAWADSDSLPDGWAEVTATVKPADIKETHDEDSKRYLSHVTSYVVGIEQVDGEWRQTWSEGERLSVGFFDDEINDWVEQPRLIAEYVDGEWIKPIVPSEQ